MKLNVLIKKPVVLLLKNIKNKRHD